MKTIFAYGFWFLAGAGAAVVAIYTKYDMYEKTEEVTPS